MATHLRDLLLGPGEAGRAIAIFPFLKTTAPVRVGSFTFRSTEDRTELTDEESIQVAEIANMLFLQDDLRIRSASYAMLPPLRAPEPRLALQELDNIQSIIAYCYSAPRFDFADTFPTFEHATIAIFSPESVPLTLVRPENNVKPLSEPGVVPDHRQHVPGYQGWYNFRQPFWVARGSRLYPPVPRLWLNIAQDLANDVRAWFTQAPQHRFLLELLRQPPTTMTTRVLTALGWYNRANMKDVEEDVAILDLAVGFEALLSLPEDAKAERFKDAVSLILGRLPRLDVWADQFYKARCRVAHEGRTELRRFVPADEFRRIDWKKSAAEGPFYQSLLGYGRQIFQLCVGALLYGAGLAVGAGLPEKLETNQERFVRMRKVLQDQTLSVEQRFAAIDDLVSIVARYQFVPEGIQLENILSVAQTAARNFIAATDLISDVRPEVERLSNARRSSDWYDVLEAVEALHNSTRRYTTIPPGAEGTMYRLIELVWRYTFTNYYRLREARGKDDTGRGEHV